MQICRTTYHINTYILHDDGKFPNNPSLPVVHYKALLKIPKWFAARKIKNHFALNGWTNSWKGSMYDFHHYHSSTHEVLAVYSGSAFIVLGGNNGRRVQLESGDVIVIPAGVAHMKMHADEHMKCVGAYPDGRDYDMLVGHDGERPEADNRIQKVPAPKKDPVFGIDGDLMFQWKGYRKTA
jgi:uncharacterized protein YjlB